MREVVFLRQRSKLLTALDRVREEDDDLVQIVIEALRPGAEVDGLFEGEGVFVSNTPLPLKPGQSPFASLRRTP